MNATNKRMLRKFLLASIYSLGIIGIVASGGGGSSSGAVPSGSSPATAAVPALAFAAVKVFQFTWTDVTDATHYKLLENPDGVSGFTQVGADISSGVEVHDHVVPLYARVNAQYILQSCNATGCTDSTTVTVAGALVTSIGYVKASNTEFTDWFGFAVSLAADGNTLAVGASGEDSNATGIDGNQADNNAGSSGAVYVFTRSGNTWTQQAYVKASNTDAGDSFGSAVSLAADGNTLAVGARQEGSNATGIDGDQNNNSATLSGAVYVFTRSGNTWTQQAYVKASNTDAGDWFGYDVSLAADGNTLAVGAYIEESNATGIDGNQADNSAIQSGAVYLY